MWADAFPLLRQSRPLVDAEAVLFVGDDQTQVGKSHLVGEQGVGAYHQVHGTGGHGVVNFSLLRRPEGTGEQSHPDAAGGQQGLQGLSVLLGQDFGGCHEGGLIAALCHEPHAGRAHHRLAAAHIPLEQAVHGDAAGQVTSRVLCRPPLSAGELEGQQGVKVTQVAAGAADALLLCPPLAEERQADGEVEQLLEDQSPPGNGQLLPRRREVGDADGVGAGGQVVALADGLGQVLRPLRPGLFQAPGHGAGQQVVGDAGGQGVDGHDAAGVLPPVLRLEDGVGHPLPPLGALDGAVEHVGLTYLQGGADVALAEKGDVQHPRVVRRSETGHFPSLGDAAGAGRLHHHC